MRRQMSFAIKIILLLCSIWVNNCQNAQAVAGSNGNITANDPGTGGGTGGTGGGGTPNKPTEGHNCTDFDWDYGDGETSVCIFEYNMWGCLKLKSNDAILNHKGKREFGQSCNTVGGENACLLLSTKTTWNYRAFDEPGVNVVNGNCRRRSNLVCHGRYNKCYCGSKTIPGEWYQYDHEDKVCYIRPGFPCTNDFDCGKKTRCLRVYIDSDDNPHWEGVCSCDYNYDTGPDDIDTSDWNHWECGTVFATKARGKLKTPFKFTPREFQTYRKGDTKLTSNAGTKIVHDISNHLYILFGLLLKVLVQ